MSSQQELKWPRFVVYYLGRWVQVELRRPFKVMEITAIQKSSIVSQKPTRLTIKIRGLARYIRRLRQTSDLACLTQKAVILPTTGGLEDIIREDEAIFEDNSSLAAA